eukprot:TRINITY_DN12483_c0_g1_i2.p1 TRINITY_DN12483_c0_g1~~TRINITY_DN12483_c0_g1_i2.p1  ORF type:complete len:701 (-),score=213.51 TRINITY_DN12483_c0_g1_i2:64-2166(-)
MFGPEKRGIIISTALEVEKIEDIYYNFPIPHKEGPVEVLLYWWTPDGEEGETRYSIYLEIEENMSIENFRTLISIADENDFVDLRILTTYAISMVNILFPSQHFHSDTKFFTCTPEYCSNHGECSYVALGQHWKKCKCDPGYRGLTCALEAGEDYQLEVQFQRLLSMVDKAQITENNVAEAAELLKTVSSIRHFATARISDHLLRLIPRIIEALGNMVLDEDVIDDIFIIIDNLNIALQQEYYNSDEESRLKPQFALSQILSIEEKLNPIFDQILAKKTEPSLRYSMEYNSINIVSAQPKSAPDGTQIIVVEPRIEEKPEDNNDDEEEEPNAEGKSIAVAIPNDVLIEKTNLEEVGIYVWEREHNPYEVGMSNHTSVISSVVSVRLKNPKDLHNDLQISDKDGVVRLYFPRQKGNSINWKLVDCAWFDRLAMTFVKRGCTTEMPIDQESSVICTCEHNGDFALITPSALAPHNRPTEGEQEEDKVPINSGGDSTTSAGDLKFKFIFLCVIFAVALWVTFFRASKKEGTNNDPFNEQLTVHPIYSILYINQGYVPKTVRVHLLFLTFAVQLAAVVLISENGSFGKVETAIVGVLISIPFNYLFGLIALVLSGGEKTEGRKVFNTLAELIILLIMLFSNFRAMDHQEFNLSTVLWPFIIGILIDLLILDVVCVFFTQISALRCLLKIRGFYTEVNLSRTSVP